MIRIDMIKIYYYKQLDKIINTNNLFIISSYELLLDFYGIKFEFWNIFCRSYKISISSLRPFDMLLEKYKIHKSKIFYLYLKFNSWILRIYVNLALAWILTLRCNFIAKMFAQKNHRPSRCELELWLYFLFFPFFYSRLSNVFVLAVSACAITTCNWINEL